MTKTCIVCGKEFETESHSRITCSEACLKIRWKVAPKVVHCIYCGAPFTRKWHGARASVCSDECRILQKAKRKKAENEGLKAVKPPIVLHQHVKTIPCLRCNKPFQSKAKDNRICSRCQNINEILDARTYAPLYDIAINTNKARRAGA